MYTRHTDLYSKTWISLAYQSLPASLPHDMTGLPVNQQTRLNILQGGSCQVETIRRSSCSVCWLLKPLNHLRYELFLGKLV